MEHPSILPGLRGLLVAGSAALFALVPLAGCSGNDNPSPTSNTFTTGTGGTGGTGGTAGGSGGTGASDPTGGTGGATGGAGGTGGQANCVGPDGCFSCAPKTDLEHLNACTDAQCSKFDNAAKLPLYDGGNLPPLP